MKKCAIFDVDLTLTKKDTFIEFYRYLCKRDSRFYIYLHKVIASGFMYFIKLYDEKKSKEQYLSFMKGLSKEFIDKVSKEFYNEWIIPKLMYNEAIYELEKRKKQGYIVVLISASPEFYLSNFNSMDCVDYVLGTRYEIENNIYTGKMIGKNNKGEEKVSRFKEFLIHNNIGDINFEESLMYSDSLNDLPMIEMVGQGFLINNKTKIRNCYNLHWK